MTNLRVTTAGESHGPYEICILEGIPAGLALSARDIDQDLWRRQQGYGRGGRMAIERDQCKLAAGVRYGRTLGSPICIIVENKDHVHWQEVMSPEALKPAADQSGAIRASRVTVPRPGHADLAGLAKYGHEDIRDVLERASARETLNQVAAGAVCRRMLVELGVTVRSRVLRIGEVAVVHTDNLTDPEAIDWETVAVSPVGCDDPRVGEAMCAAIDWAQATGESLGGMFEIWCWGICPGLGGYANMRDRLDGRLLGALGSIPAVKAVEVGPGFENSTKPGSEVHDELILRGEESERWIDHKTNRAGGLEGGMTNGMPVVLRACMKPIPTLTKPLSSVDVSTMRSAAAHVERSDITAVPAARIVGEAMVAQVMADAYLQKFGGDSMGQLLSAVRSYEADLEKRGLWRRS